MESKRGRVSRKKCVHILVMISSGFASSPPLLISLLYCCLNTFIPFGNIPDCEVSNYVMPACLMI